METMDVDMTSDGGEEEATSQKKCVLRLSSIPFNFNRPPSCSLNYLFSPINAS
jgi:hypothetical protein